MTDKTLSLPPVETLESTNVQIPYVLVGDSAFALSENLMRPYPGTYEKGNIKRIFNYRLSRARRIVCILHSYVVYHEQDRLRLGEGG